MNAKRKSRAEVDSELTRRALAANEHRRAPRFTLSLSELTDLVGSGFYSDQIDSLTAFLHCTLVNSADELYALSHLANHDDLTGEDLQNVLWRLSERMKAAAEIGWRELKKPDATTKGSAES